MSSLSVPLAEVLLGFQIVSARKHVEFLPNCFDNPFYNFKGTNFGGYRIGDTEFVIPQQGLDTRELILKFHYSFRLVQQPIIKLLYGSNWRDVVGSLSFLYQSSRSQGSKDYVNTLLLLLSQMVHLRDPDRVRFDYVLKYASESELEKFSGRGIRCCCLPYLPRSSWLGGPTRR